MSDKSDKLRLLLDGELDPESLEKDPILAKLAERIYGEDFLEKMGVSPGESKRALSETLSEDDEDELLIEVIPSIESEIVPFEAPTAADLSVDSEPMNRVGLTVGGSITGIAAVNLVGVFSFLGGSCSGGGCPADGQTRLNWMSVNQLDSGWGWSEPLFAGSIGIPDIVLLGVGIGVLAWTYLKR